MINIDNNYEENRVFVENNTINLREELDKYLIKWKWFLIGTLLSLFLSWVYLRYSTQMYSASASIMIKDNQKSGISTELAAFEDLGIVGGSANNTDNEIEILKSRRNVGRVVENLDLDVYYYTSSRVKESESYKKHSPILINFVNDKSITVLKDTTFYVLLKKDNKFDLLDVDDNLISSHEYLQNITGELGVFNISRNIKSKNKRNKIRIKIRPKQKVIDSYRKRINISPVNKNSSVLSLTLIDPVVQKAEDVLNELVRQYNIDAIKDKSEVSKKTKEFIDARLKKVKSDLYIIDKDVKEFKSEKDFTGLSVEAQLAFESLKESNQKISEAKVSLTWAEEIEKTLAFESEKDETLPSTLGFSNTQSISKAINEYNTLILQIKKTKVNAGPKNPLLIQLLNQKKSLQASLIGSLTNEANSLKLKLKELNKEQNKVLKKVKSFPDNEQGFIDIARQQEIIGGLYQYLLRKKEETDISLAVTVANAKIIDTAYGSKIPVSPKKKIVYLAALLLGILVPFVIIYIKDLLETKVHTKQDLENELQIPYLGDVPKNEGKEKIVIGSDVRSSSAEAFRLIRTNLDFMLANKSKECKTIFITSTTSGEGKSFISINLASSLAISGKRVLLIGMDLRAPKITDYLGLPEKKGVTNYITDSDLTLDELKFTIPEINGLDIISSGVVPPNPAELLMTVRVDELFSESKSKYDYIVVDTAPVNLVTDTLLLAKHADMFAYTVRANYLDKRLLAVPKNLYQEKRLPNMSIILNDTDPKKGYGYGYGGYGYGYVVVDKPWYKKIFSK